MKTFMQYCEQQENDLSVLAAEFVRLAAAVEHSARHDWPSLRANYTEFLRIERQIVDLSGMEYWDSPPPYALADWLEEQGQDEAAGVARRMPKIKQEANAAHRSYNRPD